MKSSEHEERIGLIYGLAAYGAWGLMPLFFHEVLKFVSPMELVAARVGWSIVFLCGLITALRAWGKVYQAVVNRQVMLALAGSTLMIVLNWIAYVYAVATDRVLQASLGYFITPLVNVALGVVLLQERLKNYQKLGILLAMLGVSILTIAGDEVPYIALVLAVSFGFYGLLRKLAPVDGITGLLVETALMGPASLAVLAWLRSAPGLTPFTMNTHLLLALSGVATALPLVFFGAAARRLPLVTLGVLQFLAPSMQFFVALFFMGESFGMVQLVSFLLIWTAVGVYMAGSFHGRRKLHEIPPQEPVPEEVIETA